MTDQTLKQIARGDEEELQALLETYLKKSEKLEEREGRVLRQIELMQATVSSLQAWNENRKASLASANAVHEGANEIEAETKKIKEETLRIQEEVRMKIAGNNLLRQEIERRKSSSPAVVAQEAPKVETPKKKEETPKKKEETPKKKEETPKKKEETPKKKEETPKKEEETSKKEEETSKKIEEPSKKIEEAEKKIEEAEKKKEEPPQTGSHKVRGFESNLKNDNFDLDVKFFDDKVKQLKEIEQKLRRESEIRALESKRRQVELLERIKVLENESHLNKSLISNMKNSPGNKIPTKN